MMPVASTTQSTEQQLLRAAARTSPTGNTYTVIVLYFTIHYYLTILNFICCPRELRIPENLPVLQIYTSFILLAYKIKQDHSVPLCRTHLLTCYFDISDSLLILRLICTNDFFRIMSHSHIFVMGAVNEVAPSLTLFWHLLKITINKICNQP